MSERFTELLSGVAESAASAVRAPGAAAARERGRRRRNRRRLAACVLSLALFGGVGSIAAVSSSRGSDIPVANGRASASPGVSGSPSTDVSPDKRSTTAHATTPSPPVSTSGVTPTSVSVPGPGGYVAGAWLSAAQLPFAQAGVTTWQAAAGVGTRLGGGVYEATAAQYKTYIGVCSEVGSGSGLADALGGGLTGTQYETFQSSNSDKILPDGTVPAASSELNLFYGNTADARAALAALPAGYANCKAEIAGTDPTTGETVTGQIQQTLATSSAQCWSILGGGTIEHACYVGSGGVIAAVTVTVHMVPSLSTVNFSSIDSTAVTELQQALRAYTQGS